MTDIDLRQKAFTMFAGGKKVNQVANGLFNKNWARAKKLHDEWKAEGGGNEAATMLDLAKPNGKSEAGSDAWELTINVPTSRLDAILSTFSAGEKATAVQDVLQRRFEAALGLEG